MKHILFLLAVVFMVGARVHGAGRIPLKGEWRFALDRENNGTVEKWFQRELPERLHLPGSLQEQGFGDDVSTNTQWTGTLNDRTWFTGEQYGPYRQPGNVKVPFWLQPEKYYVGTAWYQRTVTIPKNWAGKRVALTLERAHWGTAVWLDDRQIGQNDALCVPQPVVRGALSGDKLEKEIMFRSKAAGKFLKLVALSSFDDRQPYASLAELRVTVDE